VSDKEFSEFYQINIKGERIGAQTFSRVEINNSRKNDSLESKSKMEFKSDKFPSSRRKLEWQAQDTPRLWDTVMHFRPSGIRAKRPTYLPALVAITQTSIVGSLRRRLSPREAARLQGLPDWFDFGDQKPAATYKQLGNGVSVGAVCHVVRQAVRQYEEILKETCPSLVTKVLDAPENPDDALQTFHS
jgi:DNA (cytosine-5)-methyltransferase 1